MAESLKMAKMAESSPPGVVKEFLVGTSGGVTQVIIGPYQIYSC